MPVFDYAGQNNDKVWLKYSYEYRVYWSHIPQVSRVRGPHHLASSEVDASTQKIDLTDVVNGNLHPMINRGGLGCKEPDSVQDAAN